ncbi:histidinol-phosphatase [Paenibacillus graminis]|uniref:histidinol-phosphatase n=3 Tax=Paenibacillus graminis TaxID=189425 RepID=UPI002DB76AEC|nr:histidinol-phosphatase [Paenibacillus graminis]MEC0167981.1 histidinol-phosphatase [Paenibacillus graminis]
MLDLHTHHKRCGHAYGDLEDYVQEAILRGLPILGVTDHSPYFYSHENQPYKQLAMSITEFDVYMEEAVRLKRIYQGQIEVLIGVESDIFKEHIQLYGEVYAKYPIDYVIGSIHFVSPSGIMESLDFNTASEEQKQQEVLRYVEIMKAGIDSGWVQIIGHMDGFKRGYPAFTGLLAPYVDELLKRMAARGVALEINTSGIQHACKEWYPSFDVIERARFHSVPVTFGSDAHHPDRLTTDWEIVRDTLMLVGYRQVVYFRQRKPFLMDL